MKLVGEISMISPEALWQEIQRRLIRAAQGVFGVLGESA
jgi:hypothetical protein